MDLEAKIEVPNYFTNSADRMLHETVAVDWTVRKNAIGHESGAWRLPDVWRRGNRDEDEILHLLINRDIDSLGYL